MSDTINTVRPFSCGSQFGDWTASNCERCKKSQEHGGNCDIEMDLCRAYVDDGRVSVEMAKRMNVPPPAERYVWPCGEWEPTEAWKEEYRRQHPEATVKP